MFFNNNKYLNRVIAILTIVVILNALFVSLFINLSAFGGGELNFSVLKSESSEITGHSSVDVKSDIANDHLKTANSVPWVSALFITNYSPFTNYIQSGLKLTNACQTNTWFYNSCKEFILVINSFRINEYKFYQAMKIHISRLTAG